LKRRRVRLEVRRSCRQPGKIRTLPERERGRAERRVLAAPTAPCDKMSWSHER
jgi:hypothetical protein